MTDSLPGTIAELEGKNYDPSRYNYALVRHKNERQYVARGYIVRGEVKDSLADARSSMIAVRIDKPKPPVAAKPKPVAAAKPVAAVRPTEAPIGRRTVGNMFGRSKPSTKPKGTKS